MLITKLSSDSQKICFKGLLHCKSNEWFLYEMQETFMMFFKAFIMFWVLQGGVKKLGTILFALFENYSHEVTLLKRLIRFCMFVILCILFNMRNFCWFCFILDSGNVLLVGLAQTLTHYTYAGQKLVSKHGLRFLGDIWNLYVF